MQTMHKPRLSIVPNQATRITGSGGMRMPNAIRPRRPRLTGLRKRLRAARDTFIDTLTSKPEVLPKAKAFDDELKGDPIGYLISEAIDLPVFYNETYLGRTPDGLESSKQPNFKQESFAVLRASATESCFFAEFTDGDRFILHHGDSLSIQGITFTLYYASSDLWGGEKSYVTSS